MSKKYQLHTISIKSNIPYINDEIIEVNYALCSYILNFTPENGT